MNHRAANRSIPFIRWAPVLVVLVSFLVACEAVEMSEDLTPADTATGMASHDTLLLPRAIIRRTAADSILATLQRANVAFNTPVTMQLDQEVLVHLILSPDAISELRGRVEGPGAIAAATIRISSAMEAHLRGMGFEITPLTSVRQAVTLAEDTEWRWRVRPVEPGEKRLHLTMDALVDVDGEQTQRSIRTFERVINVEVPLGRRVQGFFGEHWQWLFGAILIPALGWIWKKSRRSEA